MHRRMQRAQFNMQSFSVYHSQIPFYDFCIVAHFDYRSDVWHFCSKTGSDKLEKVNERALRFVFKDRGSSYSDLLKKLGSFPTRSKNHEDCWLCPQGAEPRKQHSRNPKGIIAKKIFNLQSVW